MPSLALSSQLIWFAHCPKTGGTSVEQAMVAHWGDRIGHLFWGWDTWWAQGGWRTASTPNSPQHLTWNDAQTVLVQTPDLVFGTVRDPVARMLSEYRWQRSKRRGSCLGRWLACLPFSFWLRLMLAIARINPYAFDNHFRPQTEFVPPFGVVFKLEDGLQKVFDWLALQTGTLPITAPPPALKTDGRSPQPRAGDLARITSAFDADYQRFRYPVPETEAIRLDGLDRLAKMLAPVLAWLDRHGRL